MNSVEEQKIVNTGLSHGQFYTAAREHFKKTFGKDFSPEVRVTLRSAWEAQKAGVSPEHFALVIGFHLGHLQVTKT